MVPELNGFVTEFCGYQISCALVSPGKLVGNTDTWVLTTHPKHTDSEFLGGKV